MNLNGLLTTILILSTAGVVAGLFAEAFEHGASIAAWWLATVCEQVALTFIFG
jgi:hypothetical protein